MKVQFEVYEVLESGLEIWKATYKNKEAALDCKMRGNAQGAVVKILKVTIFESWLIFRCGRKFSVEEVTA